MDETLIQFGGPPAEAEAGPRETVRAEREHGSVCSACGQRFSSREARFCPFDGEPLEPASGPPQDLDGLVGTVVEGRYEVLDVLGEGGMGTVYRVRHKALGRAFALKALRRDIAADKELCARFIREAKAAASVSHPNVVQITDFGRLASDQPYFVMELLEGVPLGWLIKKGGPVPAARAVRIVRQIAEALGAAHEAGIVHRDLKPDNIQVGGAMSGSDVVKVLDFGLAKVAGKSRLTRQGMVFGTPHYMSPEQASGDPVDHRADIYALGVVMYEMFTGRVPFEADSAMGVLTKHMYMEPAPPSELLGGTKELGALEDLTLRCLAKKPQSRYQSMQELLEALDEIVQLSAAGDLDVRPSQAGSAPRLRSVLADELEAPSAEELSLMLKRAGVRERRSGFGVFAAVGGLLVVAAGGWWAVEHFRHAGTAAVAASKAESARAPTPAPGAGPGAGTLPASRSTAALSAAAAIAPAPAPASRRHTTARRATGPGHVKASPRVQSRLPAATARPTRSSQSRIGGGEIIDPWAK